MTKSGVSLTKESRGRGRSGDFPRLLSGWLCLDFANSVDAPLMANPVDFLNNYSDIAWWTWHAGALQRAEAVRLVKLASASPEEAESVYDRALSLRQAIADVFGSFARNQTPATEDLVLLKEEFAEAISCAELLWVGGHFAWSWEQRRSDLRQPLWLVTYSALELLTRGDLDRVKQCPGAGDCGWLFYDTSKIGRRRWCSMEGCGSRVKMLRQYSKQKAQRGARGG